MTEKTANLPKSPKEATHDEVLTPRSKATVTYGGKEYDIYPLSVKSILRIVRIVANQFSKMRNLKDSLNDEASALITLLENLDEDVIYELVGIILNVENDEVMKGYKTADALSVLTASFELEDVQQIFFQIRKMAATLKSSGKAQ